MWSLKPAKDSPYQSVSLALHTAVLSESPQVYHDSKRRLPCFAEPTTSYLGPCCWGVLLGRPSRLLRVTWFPGLQMLLVCPHQQLGTMIPSSWNIRNPKQPNKGLQLVAWT